MQAVADDKHKTYLAWLLVIGLALGTGLFLSWLFSSSQPPDFEAIRWSVFYTGVLGVVGGGVLVSGLCWRQMNRRRQAAARGLPGAAPLAAIQPFPDETGLPLPCLIVQKKSRLRDLTGFLGILVGVYALGEALDTMFSGGTLLSLFMPHLISSWAFLAGMLAGRATRLFLDSPYTLLKISNEELTHSTSTGKKVVGRWEDARLLAVRGPRTTLGKATTYELASPRAVVTWKSMQRLRWWTIERPVVPFEEYERQMEALLSVIVAKTHLPLYDVREAGR